MAAKPGAPRRKHSLELKAAVVEECRRPGVSVAAIALAHGLNANLVHQWMRNARASLVSCLISAPNPKTDAGALTTRIAAPERTTSSVELRVDTNRAPPPRAQAYAPSGMSCPRLSSEIC